MAAYKPQAPFSTPMVLLAPTWTTVQGVAKKTFPAVKDGIAINGSFRTYGGTERDVNGLYTVEKTAIVETWYRPEVRADCRIALPQTGEVYEILGDPENIEMRNQYLKMKVRQVKGGA